MPLLLASVLNGSHAWSIVILWYDGRVVERDVGVDDEVRIKITLRVAQELLETESRHCRAEGPGKCVRRK